MAQRATAAIARSNPSARRRAREAQQMERELLNNILSFSSEQQRLRHIRSHQPYSLAATLGDAEALAEAVLIYKGLVLDSLIEDLRLAEALERVVAAAQEIARIDAHTGRGAPDVVT